jgi:hypothetical protein
MVLLCGGRLATAAVPERFVALPPELGIKAPARLVFSVEDLAACWNDQTARRCILRGMLLLWLVIQGGACFSTAAANAKHAVVRCQQRSCNMRSLPVCTCVCVCCPACCCACTPMRTVMLAAPVRIVDGNWRRAFASTGGVATQAGPLSPLTITSGKHCPGHKQAKRTCQTCQCRPLACVLPRMRTQPFSSGCDSFSAAG